MGEDLGEPGLHVGVGTGFAARAGVVDVRVGGEDLVELVEVLGVERPRVPRQDVFDLEAVGEGL